MARRRDDVDVRWLQVPADLVTRKAEVLAALLTGSGRRRVSEGDALMVVLRLWQAVLDRVRDDAQDIRGALEAAAVLRDTDAQALAAACRWPPNRALDLFAALAHPSVGVLEECQPPTRWRVLDLPERYANLAERRADSRGRSQAHRLARKAGLKAHPDGGWVLPGGEVLAWQEVLARYHKTTQEDR